MKEHFLLVLENGKQCMCLDTFSCFRGLCFYFSPKLYSKINLKKKILIVRVTLHTYPLKE